MGEGGGGESGERGERGRVIEVNEDNVERVVEILNEIELLLGKLIEQGGEWDAQKKKAVRQRIAGLLSQLGIENYTEFKDLAQIYGAVERVKQDLGRGSDLLPSGFPTREEFMEQSRVALDEVRDLYETLNHGQARSFDVSGLIREAWFNPYGFSGRGGGQSLGDHLYGLGIVMSRRILYEEIFRSDKLRVATNWRVDNGRHRALTLKTLGQDYIDRVGLSEWIEVLLED